MQVLGSLIKLPRSSELPLPWYHRSPLGLLNSTPVHAALVKSPKRPLPDIIVSVLDPDMWSRTISIECIHPDDPGVILKAIETELVKKFNIALAESVTIESGTHHQITLICELANPEVKRPRAADVSAALKKRGFTVVKPVSYFAEADILTAEPAEVANGWITRFPWRAKLEDHFNLVKDRDKYDAVDLHRAVVSADTDKRILRYVFPHKFARTLEVVHADRPGVLREIMRVFSKNNLNVLSALLRRGGVPRQMAVLIAVCEPTLRGDSAGSVSEDWHLKVKADIDKIRARTKATVTTRDGTGAALTTSLRSEQTVVARIPTDLLSKVAEVKRDIPRGRLGVFVSRRFVKDAYNRMVHDAVTRALVEYGAHPIEAQPHGSLLGQYMVHREVSARMWAADAGIVILASTPGNRDHVGQNIPHELGFLMGQGKPVCILGEKGTAPWANMEGVFFPRFSVSDWENSGKVSRSISRLVQQFVEEVREIKKRQALEPPI